MICFLRMVLMYEELVMLCDHYGWAGSLDLVDNWEVERRIEVYSVRQNKN